MNQKIDPTDVSTLSEKQIRAHSTGIRLIGIGLLVVGVIAMLLPTVFTLGFELVIGVLLLLGGILQLAGAFNSTGHTGSAFRIATGILSVLLGIVFLANPFEGAAILTLFLGGLFLLNGLFRLFIAMGSGGIGGRGWGFLGGFIGIVLAVFVFASWPESSAWVIGIFLGIDLLMAGIAFLLLPTAAKAART